MQPAELRLRRIGRHLDVGDDGRAVVQIVQHENVSATISTASGSSRSSGGASGNASMVRTMS